MPWVAIHQITWLLFFLCQNYICSDLKVRNWLYVLSDLLLIAYKQIKSAVTNASDTSDVCILTCSWFCSFLTFKRRGWGIQLFTLSMFSVKLCSSLGNYNIWLYTLCIYTLQYILISVGVVGACVFSSSGIFCAHCSSVLSLWYSTVVSRMFIRNIVSQIAEFHPLFIWRH